jgi:hypothetical protein
MSPFTSRRFRPIAIGLAALPSGSALPVVRADDLGDAALVSVNLPGAKT